MSDAIRDFLVQQGLGTQGTAVLAAAVEIALVVTLAFIANLVAKRIIVRGLVELVSRTTTGWDDFLVERRLFHSLSHLAPVLVIYIFAGPVGDRQHVECLRRHPTDIEIFA